MFVNDLPQLRCTWRWAVDDNDGEWNELILIGQSSLSNRMITDEDESFPMVSITDLDGVVMTSAGDTAEDERIMIVTASSMGVHVLHVALSHDNSSRNGDAKLLELQPIGTYTTASVQIQSLQPQSEENEWILAVGTDSPRNNKIHIYTAHTNTDNKK